MEQSSHRGERLTANIQKFRNLSTAVNHSFKSRWLLHHYRLLHHGPDTMEELLDRHVVKKEKSLDDDENDLLNRQRLTSSRREALSLYRDVIRVTRFFMWSNSQGIPWRDVLRENVQKELVRGGTI
ncbi:hypothetical protein MTR67_010215 [Solanum verrucosum]|uniref:Uncharacterized protein n=1 Tax=Solanum verrucosum TaxID=315347 RepID=A0AAF0Q8P7_SOLVR|nr:hypothetical protein MTR67_010215 [Solanum verrucosum]